MFEMLILMLDATIPYRAAAHSAAMAGMFCERSGVVNIALEGKLLASAFASAAAAAVTGSAWIGLGAGVGSPSCSPCCTASPPSPTAVIRRWSGMPSTSLAAGLTVTWAVTGSIRAARPRRSPGDARFCPPSTCPMPRIMTYLSSGQPLQRALERSPCWEYVAFAAVPWFAALLACGCGRWAKPRRRSTPPASPW